ncbi:MAG: hypothetical protein H0T18_04275 [Chloroflexia bacterium]|nr:hypothetical protein [Chloroflexia bacterium]
MRFISSRIPHLIVVATLVLSATGSLRPTVSAQDATPAAQSTPESAIASADAERFGSLLAAQEGVSPIAGPFVANLKETEGSIAFSWAGVNEANVHAHAVFDVPETISTIPWDIGFIFGATPSGSLRLAADSLGTVWFNIGGVLPTRVGTVEVIQTAPGQSNTLDLLVAGPRAFLGVNGTLVATVDLPVDASGADVAAGSGFYTDQTLIDRLTQFHDFVIRPLDPDALGSALPPTATPTADDREVFAERLAELENETPAAGPFAGRLVEATSGTAPLAPAGVSLASFAAVATFINPADPTLGLWDTAIQFRVDGAERNRVIVDSLGDAYVGLASENARKLADVPSYDDTPGAENTLQLIVDGNRALFGVNDEFVAAIDLAAPPVTADVQIGSGFFNEDFVVGRTIDYRDFRVWEVT